MSAPIDEFDPRSHHQIFDRPGHQHLTRLRYGSHPRRDVNRNAAEVIPDQLALACMKSGPDLDAEFARLPNDRARAVNRARGTVETREEAIPGLLYLAAAEALELRANERVVAFANLAP